MLASTLAHFDSEINKAFSVTYKLLFTLSKILFLADVIAISDIANFPVTVCHPLYIYTKFDVSNGIFGCWQAPWPTLLRK